VEALAETRRPRRRAGTSPSLLVVFVLIFPACRTSNIQTTPSKKSGNGRRCNLSCSFTSQTCPLLQLLSTRRHPPCCSFVPPVHCPPSFLEDYIVNGGSGTAVNRSRGGARPRHGRVATTSAINARGMLTDCSCFVACTSESILSGNQRKRS
jgi:hypothetical protein